MKMAPAFAGQFYPDDPAELAAMVDGWFDEVQALSPAPIALLVPHAGYVYSGCTAARAIAAAATADPDTVFLGGPSHRVAVDGAVALLAESFETPLGPVECDLERTRRLVEEVAGLETCEPFAEHSLEVQLPLIRRVWPRARVVAIAFGAGDLELATRLAGAIDPAVGTGECMFVGSTDLSHYHDRQRARSLDGRFRQLLTTGESESMLDALRRGATEACGAGSVLTFMELARRRQGEIVVVDQCDSGDAFGETDHVVGYLSAALRPRTP